MLTTIPSFSVAGHFLGSRSLSSTILLATSIRILTSLFRVNLMMTESLPGGPSLISFHSPITFESVRGVAIQSAASLAKVSSLRSGIQLMTSSILSCFCLCLLAPTFSKWVLYSSAVKISLDTVHLLSLLPTVFRICTSSQSRFVQLLSGLLS